MTSRFNVVLGTFFLFLSSLSIELAAADEHRSLWDFNNSAFIDKVEGWHAIESIVDGGEYGKKVLQARYQSDNDYPSISLQLDSVEDWSSYAYLSIEVYNAEKEPVTVFFGVQDTNEKTFQPSRQIPPKSWETFSFAVRAMDIGSDIGAWFGDAIDVRKVSRLEFFLEKPPGPMRIGFGELKLVKIATLPAPTVVAKGAGDGIELGWSVLDGAIMYDIYRAKEGGGESKLARFPAAHFVDTTAVQGTNYQYRVAGVNSVLLPGAKSSKVTARRANGAAAALPALGRFGGRKDRTLAATGYFRIEKVKGHWTLVDPEGHPFFSVGIDVIDVGDTYTKVSGRTGEFSKYLSERNDAKYKDAWTPSYGFELYGVDSSGLVFSQYVRSQIAKYGRNWTSKWSTETAKRLQDWRINTISAWSRNETIQESKMPYVEVGMYSEDWAQIPPIRMPDVYDPSFERISNQLAIKAAKSKYDPYLIGRFADNEMDWLGYWMDNKSIVQLIHEAPKTLAAKRAWVRYLEKKYTKISALNKSWKATFASFSAMLASTDGLPSTQATRKDASEFFEKFAERYFRITTQALKRHDPNHLVIGVRYAGVAPDEVIRANGRYSDVISVNIYDLYPQRERFKRYEALTSKPWIIGEFCIIGADSGLTTAQTIPTVPTQAERGLAYQAFVSEAAVIPNLVGVHWFEYIDLPKTGRFDDESYGCGWVNINDKPYSAFIDRARLFNNNLPFIYED